MKHLIFFPFFIFILSCFYSGCTSPPAEEPIEIHIGFDYDNFVKDEQINVQVGQKIKFIRDDEEDYAVIVPNAQEFLNIDKNHLLTLSHSTGEAEIFDVVKKGDEEYGIVIYCITKKKLNDPEAPPRIIIRSEQ